MRSIYPSCFSEWLCAGQGTRLKGEPTISNYGSQGKSQASQMETKGVAVLQRGIGDGASEGSGSAEAE